MQQADFIILLSAPSKKEIDSLSNSTASIVSDDSIELPETIRRTTIEIDETSVNRKTLKQIQQFGHEFINGKKVIDFLSFENNTYWFHLKFRIYHRVKTLFLHAAKIRWVLNQNNRNKKILIVSNQASALKAFFNDYENITFHHPISQTEKTTSSSGLKYLLSFIARFFIGLLGIPTLFKKGRNVILIKPDRQDNIIDINTLKPGSGDNILDYLIQGTLQSDDFIYLTDFYPPAMGKAVRSKAKTLKTIFPQFKKTIHFEGFIILSLLRPSTWRGFKKIKNSLQQINTDSGSPEKQVIANIIKGAKFFLLLSLCRVKAVELFLKVNKPRSISGTNEHDRHKAFSMACQKAEIPFIAFQHGALWEFNAAYNFLKEDITYQPIPKHTLTWGTSWNQNMMRFFNYPEASITALGQIRTDIIPKLKSAPIYPKEISPEKPLLLYCSQPLLSTEEYIRSVLGSHFFRLSKAFPEVQFILKPHPLEKNWDFFYDLAKKEGAEHFKILDTDLYQLINLSDIMLTYHSTVGTEAVYFGKPVLVADYNQNNDSAFGREGVGYRFSNYEKLLELTQDLITKKRVPDPQKQENFIKEFAFSTDGNTTKRYINFIRNFKATEN